MKNAFGMASFCLVLFIGNPSMMADEHEFSIAKVASLEKSEGATFYVADFDLGTFDAGSSGLVELTLRNPLDDDVTFASANMQCSCVEFQSSTKTIPAHGSITAKLRLKTPLRAKSSETTSLVSLLGPENNSGSVVRIRLKYRLSAMLAVDRQLADLEIGKEQPATTLNMGVRFTDPIQLENLSVSAADVFQNVTFELVPTPKGAMIVAEMPATLIAQGPTAGEVVVKDEVTGKSDRFYCTVRNADGLKISPSILRFQRDRINPTYVMAHAVIRRPLESDPVQGTNVPIKAECSIQGVPVTISQRAVGQQIIRLKLLLPIDQLQKIRQESSEMILDFKIDDGQQSHDLKVRAVFLD